MRMQEKTLDLPRNKVLIVFGNNDYNYQKKLVFQLFGHELNEGDRIIKNLVWKTKYYQVEFDLYIDDYDTFSSWFEEFSSQTYVPLRQVIAGLVVVDEYKNVNQLNEISLQDSFVVWVNTSPELDQDKVDEINDQSIQIQEGAIELINLNATEAVNKYGEKVGVPRFKEIMDTCQWKRCQLHFLNVTGETTNSCEPSLELMIRRIQHARQKHANSELDNEEAMQIAYEIANELVENEN